jgi:dCMP deaminase
VSENRLSLQAYALRLARTASERSEDPYNKVGAALIRPDKTVAAIGYNGAPPGVEIDWSDRDGRRDHVIHAEANALRFVHPGEVMFAATTMHPCQICVLLLASYGINLVVYSDPLDPKVYSVEFVKKLAEEVGVNIYHVEER